LNLQFDTEQIILRDTAESFLHERYDYDTYQRVVASDEGWSAELWREFAQLGWLGMPFATEDGGVGGGAVETAILMEAFGRFLVIEPYIPTVLLAGGMITALGSTAERRALLAPVSEGRSRLAFAFADRDTTTAARASTRGFLLTGAKSFVIGGPMADTLLVSARIGTSSGDSGIGVFVVPKNAPGVATKPFRTVDGRRAADVELTSVALPTGALLGGNEKAGTMIDGVIDHAIAALSADAVGAIAAMVTATVDYAKTRVQFGQPLAKFQALQHRMVRMRVNEEEARASALFATLSLEGPVDRRTRAISGAKAKIGRCARFVHQNAIQLHGAIGTTNELSLGAYAKRLLAYEAMFGSTREHLRRYGSLISKPDIAAEGLLAAAG
jgi:alkylation response protein AidB-like acyl-CoA dehydrogenase